MHGLTEKQKNILRLIAESVETNGYPPTYQQLCNVLGISSKNAIKKHIDALVVKGFLSKDSTPRGISIVDPEYKPQLESGPSIPLIGHIAAGFPVLADQNVERYIPVPRHLIRSEGRYYALRVRGDSMMNAGILNDDLVIVQATTEARHRDIVVALIGDEVTVKRLYAEGRRIYLKAENPDYEDIFPQNTWSIQGKVVGLVRENIN